MSTQSRYKVPLNSIHTRREKDVTGVRGTYDYETYSLNYFVNLGPVDVYQMHRYGGDDEYKRESGLSWLKRMLARKGYGRPVIIVQHYLFSPDTITPTWTDEQRDRMLEVLLPYNIVAFFVGHNHAV